MRAVQKACIYLRLLPNRGSVGGDISSVIVQGRRGFKIQQLPCPLEVSYLNQRFHDPVKTIHQLMVNYASNECCYEPQLQQSTELRSGLWRAKLTVGWPLRFTVCGLSDDADRARHYAYLQACELMVHMGLLRYNGDSIDYKTELHVELNLSNRYVLTKSSKRPVKFHSVSQRGDKTSESWKTSLSVIWPSCNVIEVQAVREQKQQAEQSAAAMAFVSLKGRRLLDTDNKIRGPGYHAMLPLVDMTSEFQPDFEFYVDASTVGYGAYLKSAKSGDETVHWFQEPWEETVQAEMAKKLQTNFLEFYGLVAAVYTWKKKFQGKHVLCWSDNMTCVGMVTDGHNLNRISMTNKIFEVLQTTCIRYDIQLKAKHVRRGENKAAHSLSKLRTAQFLEMTPNARGVPKKSKKLLFFLPFVEPTFVHETRSKCAKLALINAIDSYPASDSDSCNGVEDEGVE